MNQCNGNKLNGLMVVTYPLSIPDKSREAVRDELRKAAEEQGLRLIMAPEGLTVTLHRLP